MNFYLPEFISQHVTGRTESLFQFDLNRHAPELDTALRGKKMLVIGGAGSIGSSFIRASLQFAPALLVVADTNENALTELTRDLRSSPGFFVPPSFLTYPVDFGDPVFLKIMQAHGPFDVVANFAAHKHVRSEKDPFAIEAMITNNVLKARKLLGYLTDAPPSHFFCVSTDKAANPVNVMGASKKLMEDLILAFAGNFKVSTARFANVAFSNGSLLAGFKERLLRRQPIAAPRDVRRYFVSPEESGELCLLACILGNTGEIFFPKLRPEQMLTFSEIATTFLAANGLKADLCSTEEEARQKSISPAPGTWPVYYFDSDTSGEKPFEEFYTSADNINLNRFRELGVIITPSTSSTRASISEIDQTIAQLTNLFNSPNPSKSSIVALLEQILPGFRHIETGKNLDQKM